MGIPLPNTSSYSSSQNHLLFLSQYLLLFLFPVPPPLPLPIPPPLPLPSTSSSSSANTSSSPSPFLLFHLYLPSSSTPPPTLFLLHLIPPPFSCGHHPNVLHMHVFIPCFCSVFCWVLSESQFQGRRPLCYFL